MSGAVRRVAIVGPESCGKTTLAQQLAAATGSAWVKEVARGWLDVRGGRYEEGDLVEIARMQRRAEDVAAAGAGTWLFCDTNLLVVRIWSEVKYGRVDPAIPALEQLHTYDLHLLTAPDLPWTYDPLREHPDRRDELFARYEQALQGAGVGYRVVRGAGDERLNCALRALEVGGP